MFSGGGEKWAKWEIVVIPYHWCNLIKLIFQRYSFETENILSKQKWSRFKFWSTKFYFDFLTSKLLSKWNWTLLHIIMCQQTISLKVVSIYFQKTFVEEDFFWNISGCRVPRKYCFIGLPTNLYIICTQHFFRSSPKTSSSNIDTFFLQFFIVHF